MNCRHYGRIWPGSCSCGSTSVRSSASRRMRQRDEQLIKEITVDGNLAAVRPYDLPTAVQACEELRRRAGHARLPVLQAGRNGRCARDLQLAVHAMQWVDRACPG